MTTEVHTYVMSVGSTVRAPRGRFFFIKSAPSGSHTITAAGRPGSPLKFSNISAGLKYGPVDESDTWQYLDITTVSAQTVEIIIGDDDVEVAGVATITGTVTVNQIGRTLVSAADVSVATVSTAVVAAANSGRENLLIGSLSTNPGSVRIGDASVGAARGIELQPGQVIELETLTAVSVYNPNATACAFQILEFT